MSDVASQPVGEFLADLAARNPTPGGGAAAALHAAQAAALVAMVARYSDRQDGPDAQRAVETAAATATEADALRLRALELLQADMDGFAAVGAAYRLPRESDADRARRQEAIALASLGAAEPPAQVITVATRVVELAAALREIANPNLITDVAAAADTAAAALATARINVEVNLRSVPTGAARDRLTEAVAGVSRQIEAAADVSARVRRGITR